jgi:hypothetical protein
VTDDSPEFETAFIIAMRKDGSFFATVDVSTEFTIERRATRQDVKRGTQDILEVIQQGDLTAMIMTQIRAEGQSETEKATSSIRQALSEKGIL